MRRRELVLIFVVWILASALIFSYFDIPLVLDPLFVLYAVIVLFLIRGLWAWNWRSLNRAAGLKHDYTILLKGTFIAAFTDTITPPLTPSAELATSYYLKKKFGGKVTDYLPIAFLESTTVFLSQVLIFLAAALTLGGFLIDASIYLVGALLVFFVILLLAWKFREKIIKDFLKLSVEHLKALDGVLAGIHSITSENKLLFARVVVITLFSLILEASVVYFLVGKPEVFTLILIAFMGSRLISVFSMVPGGIGVYEVSMASILSLGGIELPALLSAVIVYRTLFFWFNILLGSFFTGSEIYGWVKRFQPTKLRKLF